MPFIASLTRLRSLSIVGMAKNTGKTETLNYLLRRLASYPELRLGLTSIGIDGERRDQVTRTDKPEITLRPGMVFVTAEKFYRRKQLAAAVWGIDDAFTTSLGRAVYAEARGTGKTLIAGPATTGGLAHVVKRLHRAGVDLAIIDGALSRLSLAAPSLAEGMILATGAAYSIDVEKLVRDTKALMRLIELPAWPDSHLAMLLADLDEGVYYITEEGELLNTGFSSLLSQEAMQDTRWMSSHPTLFVPGVISDKLLERLRRVEKHKSLVAKDFTRIFASPLAVNAYLGAGKALYVLHSTHLMAVTFNPQAPSGYRLDSSLLTARLSDELGLPVYDVRKISQN